MGYLLEIHDKLYEYIIFYKCIHVHLGRPLFIDNFFLNIHILHIYLKYIILRMLHLFDVKINE